MAWIESHTTLARHPKTLRLARILGIPVPAALGHLHLLWWWAIEYAPDGNVGRFEAAELALACMWDGDEAALMPAFQRAGFVNDDGTLHDWHDYAGKLVDRRRLDAERKRDGRRTDVQSPPSINSADIQRTSGGHPADVSRTVPNQPNQPNQPSAPDGAGPALHAVPKPSNPKPKPSAREQLPTHPAVRVLRLTLGFAPDERQRETISQSVGSDEEALRLWEECCTAWKDAGYNSRNLAGVLDWFQEGGPPPRIRPPNGALNGPANGKPAYGVVAALNVIGRERQKRAALTAGEEDETHEHHSTTESERLALPGPGE
jgi:hypothetical protein